MTAGGPVEPLARYFECWLLRLQGVYPARGRVRPVRRSTSDAGDGAFLAADGHGFVCRGCHGAQGTDDRYLSAPALAFVRAARRVRPSEAAALGASPAVLRELEVVHRALIAAHFDRPLKSVRVVQDLTRPRR